MEGVTDNYDLDVGQMVVSNNVDLYTVGSYQVVFKAYDDSHNSLEKTMNVYVIDTTPPTYDGYFDFAIGITSNTSFDFTDKITNEIDNSGEAVTVYQIDCNVDGNTPGNYTATIGIKDAYGNEAIQIIQIEVIDHTAPTFDYINTQTIEVDQYQDIDWTTIIENLFEDSDTLVTLEEISDDVLYDTLGEYYVVVKATDASLNSKSQTFLVEVVDTQAPVITLNGDSIITLEAGDIYLNEGATCTDNYDDACTVSIGGFTVDYGTVGEYYIEYIAEDSSGNIGRLKREVIVIDTITPTFEVSDFIIQVGHDEINFFYHIGLIEENSDDELIKEVISNNVDYFVVGDYEVILKVSDQSGNSTTKTILVSVIDTIAPEFEIPEILDYEVGFNEVIDWTTFISNIVENSLTEVVITITENVNFNIIGSNRVEYTLSDGNGNSNTQSMRVVVRDTTSPTFDNIPNQTIELGEYETFDWTTLITNIEDNYSEIFFLSEIKDDVDYSRVGSYLVIVEVKDNYSNTVTQEFTVNVVDTTKPLVMLNPSVDTITVGSEYIDAGVIYSDLSEVTLEVDNLVDVDTPGTYLITYTVTDASGNITIKKRYVTVKEASPTVEFILNNAVTTIKINETFIDTGCVVKINDQTFDCTVKEYHINNQEEGIYYIIYTYTYEGVEYEYYRFIFVTEDGFIPNNYFFKKEEEEEGDLS
ncbi:immunoglobulin-like domain-containing protein [Candidatus Izemoplasma sp. B36]|uniref:immunoglobulin-like domain-containing protein n=1 Tax=Candidatus Izemoplasma sp. B36 TaxID=3242468 RepID=UPI003555E9B6